MVNRSGTDFEYLHGEFVTQNTRISKEWLRARIGVQIGAANPYSTDTNLDFINPRMRRHRGIQ
jgi:hypothetical protein